MMLKSFIIWFVLIPLSLFAQSEGKDIDIFIIDSYVTPGLPYIVKVTFFTSEKVKSKIIFDGNIPIVVSNSFVEDHSFSIPLNKLQYDSTIIPFVITVSAENGESSKSDSFDLYLPDEYSLDMKYRVSFYQVCLGALTYLIPSPTLSLLSNGSYFALSKEIPIVSFYNAGYNFPSSYLDLEYSYIFGVDNSNYLRGGYKYIFRTNFIKYISPGINLTTNFSDFNGISPELSFGLFQFYETFTLYTRFRYNYNFDIGENNFMDFSVGLFTSVISFNF